MSHLSKAKAHIQTARAANTRATAEVTELAGDIAREVTRQIDHAVEQALTAEQRTEIQAKREAISGRFGQIVADNLTGKALDSLYEQVKASGSPATNDHQQAGVPDPGEYFGAAARVDSRSPDPGGYFFND